MPAADYRLLTDATGQRMAAALEGMSVDRAAKTDLTSIIATGTTNTTGAAIAAGTYFYLNGALVQAKTDISSGATFTNGTNYEAVTAGGLNSLNNVVFSLLKPTTRLSTSNDMNYIDCGAYYQSGVGLPSHSPTESATTDVSNAYILCLSGRKSDRVQIWMAQNNNRIYVRFTNDWTASQGGASIWTQWYKIAYL